jgi:hypothetical protein
MIPQMNIGLYLLQTPKQGKLSNKIIGYLKIGISRSFGWIMRI